eukprot:TRINITY_DN12265_c3_g1_i1.p1 TRINITY_DN12265_c3_g1~~TRINITY_DN12265_c3_g1_i1.p1  ORF type:complete len:314 (+),score=53.11 TRINITY_DN12265_c3_g1_i1:45-944(+)
MDTLQQRIINMYSYYNPSKLPVVGDMLRDARGQEEELLTALMQMYGQEPRGSFIGLGYRERLGRFYTKYNRTKLGEVDTLLYTYRGREEELFSALVQKYGPEPSPVPVDPRDNRLLNDNLRVLRVKQIYSLKNITNIARFLLRKSYFLKWVQYLQIPRHMRRAAVSFQTYSSEMAPYHSAMPARASETSHASGGVVVVHHHHHHGKKTRRSAVSPPRVHLHASPDYGYVDPWEWSHDRDPRLLKSKPRRKPSKKKKHRRRSPSTDSNPSPRRMLKRSEKEDLVAEVLKRLHESGRTPYY